MKKIVTHNGTFHPDDVCAVATLKMAFPNEEFVIVRTRDPKEFQDADFVLDVSKLYDGLKYFDHHQLEGAGKRDNGIPYASFGLVWKKFGMNVCKTELICDAIDKKIVQVVDAGDNGVNIYNEIYEGVSPFGLTSVIASFNPTALESREEDKCFADAVKFAIFVLERAIAFEKVIEEAQKVFEDAYNNSEDKRVLVFDRDLDWKFYNGSRDGHGFDEVLYIVYPSDDRWSVRAVRKDPKKFETKKPFPEPWAGLSDEELEKVSGVTGAVFCHRARFLVVAKTKEAALSLASKALL